MDAYLLLALILGSFIFLMFLGFPLAFSFLAVMLISSFLIMGPSHGFSFFLGGAFDSLTKFTLIPIPMFILMGAILFHSGVATRCINGISIWLGPVPGRLSILANLTGGLMGLLSGSTLGTTGLLGTLLVPEMRKRGYSKAMTYGPILASGGLAMIIPPSTLTVVFATIAHISVGRLLLACLIPGFLMVSFYLLQIIVRSILNPSLAPKYEFAPSSFKEKIKSLLIDVLPLGLIIFLVTGLIVIGVATPSEAASTGALGAIILTAAYGLLRWGIFVNALKETVKLSVMIFMIISGSVVYSQLLAYSGISRAITQGLVGLEIPWITILIMMLIVLVMGTMMDQIAIIMITVPVFIPVINALEFDPFLFGVLMLINLQIALTTPPIGMLLFVIKGISPEEVSMPDLYKSALPFIACDAVVMIIIILIPSIALWLPGLP